jgi:histone deacetylase 6
MGEGAGVGYTVNCPWTVTGCGDADYLAAVHLLLLPIARAFDPQLVLVSAGFDAADGDVQGGMRVSPWGFAQLTCALGSLGRPMALALEGGYNQQVTAACVAEVARGLLGDVPLLDPIQCASRQPVAAHAEAQVRAAIALQAVHWPALGEDGHIALVEQYFELSRRHAAEPARSSQRVQAAARPPLAAEPPRGAADGGGGGKAKRAKPAAREEERPGNGAAAQMP